MNTGLFTPSATMAQQLETAAQIAGEKIWRMPLVEPYALSTILQSGNSFDHHINMSGFLFHNDQDMFCG